MSPSMSFFTSVALALLLVTPGCGPRIAKEDLGEISATLPVLPGTDEPYPLPELEVPSAVDAAAAAADDDKGAQESPTSDEIAP